MRTLLDDLVEDWSELVPVEGGGSPGYDPVDPVGLVQTLGGRVVLVRPELHQVTFPLQREREKKRD